MDASKSFSVLVPAQRKLTHQGCFEDERRKLLDWFAKVELRAWEMVYAYHGDQSRPSKIFLVTAQTLTPGYAITHKQSGSTECEILISANIPLPAKAEANAFLGYKIETAHASHGFDEVKAEQSGEEYAIFLNVYYSCPTRRIRLGSPSLRTRVSDMYK